MAEAAKDNLTDTGVDESKITVILNGVAGLQSMDAGELEKTRERFGIKNDEKVVSAQFAVTEEMLNEGVKIRKGKKVFHKAVLV